MTRLSLIVLSVLVLVSCSSNIPCKEGINLLPMYGNVPKCKEQVEIDNDFLSECDKIYPNRKAAARHHIQLAWDYLYKQGDMDVAMKRFNQAWLLDSANADIYWGFGNILGMKHQVKESIPFFEKSIKMNPANENVYECIAVSYSQLFVESKNKEYLNKAIGYLKTSIQIAPTALAYGQLTAAYSYYIQKDSARKYLALTDALDSNAVNPEVRKILE